MKQEKIKGIVIDPNTREVCWMEFTNSLEGFHELLDCERIDRVSFDDYNDLVVDGEGLHKNPKTFFTIEGLEGCYVGKAVIVGVDFDEGVWLDAFIDENKLKVHFYLMKGKSDDSKSRS